MIKVFANLKRLIVIILTLIHSSDYENLVKSKADKKIVIKKY